MKIKAFLYMIVRGGIIITALMPKLVVASGPPYIMTPRSATSVGVPRSRIAAWVDSEHCPFWRFGKNFFGNSPDCADIRADNGKEGAKMKERALFCAELARKWCSFRVPDASCKILQDLTEAVRVKQYFEIENPAGLNAVPNRFIGTWDTACGSKNTGFDITKSSVAGHQVAIVQADDRNLYVLVNRAVGHSDKVGNDISNLRNIIFHINDSGDVLNLIMDTTGADTQLFDSNEALKRCSPP